LFTRHAGFRRWVALLLAAVLPSACVTWQPVMGRADYVTAARPGHVRAVLADDRKVDLYSPTAVGNQLVGFRQKGVDSSRVSIATREIKRIEVRKIDQRTTTTVVATATVVGLMGAFLALAVSSVHFGFTFPFGRE
jgi:hypothetical protein